MLRQASMAPRTDYGILFVGVFLFSSTVAYLANYGR